MLLTGYVGPKTFAALNAAGVKIGQNLDNMTVAEAVDLYKAGKVEFADAPKKPCFKGGAVSCGNL